MDEIENRLITFTQAAYILGYKNYRSILRLIKEGHLREYVIPNTKRRRLYLDEVMKVAEHGGRLTFKSTVGKGSAFTIFLPSDSRTS